jgi:L,D-peptidoglycan transpeptidase YkuD (ErfK/YbiS/YcfS/YnhG family)
MRLPVVPSAAISLALLASSALAQTQPSTATATAVGRPLAAATTEPSGSSLASAIRVRPRVRQLITISSPSWSATTGRLRAWHRSVGGSWMQVHGPVPVVLGYSGWVRSTQRVQSTGTTPAGIFRLPFGFGRLADPGSGLPYRQYDRNDWWPYEPRDPATYNVYQRHRAAASHWRSDYSEHLADYPTQYAYSIVVGFNLPSGVHYSTVRGQRVAASAADTSRGGGIFLHVAGAGLTAGCVAMPRVQLGWLLRWLDPPLHPRVAMGPHRYLLRH